MAANHRGLGDNESRGEASLWKRKLGKHSPPTVSPYRPPWSIIIELNFWLCKYLQISRPQGTCIEFVFLQHFFESSELIYILLAINDLGNFILSYVHILHAASFDYKHLQLQSIVRLSLDSKRFKHEKLSDCSIHASSFSLFLTLPPRKWA